MSSVWNLDQDHSFINFSIRHLLVKVKGRFLNFGLLYKEKAPFETSTVDFTVQTSSVETGNLSRDIHLGTSDFFDSVNYPQLRFKSTGMVRGSDDLLIISGNLVVKNQSVSVEVKAQLVPLQTSDMTKSKNYTITAQISRKEIGLHWNGLSPDGLPILGDTIDIHGNMRLLAKPLFKL